MLVVNHFLDLWLKFMVRIQQVCSDCGGTWYHEARSSLGLKHRLHTCSRKARLIEERFSISKTGHRILMITIVVPNRDYVTYRMYTMAMSICIYA